MQITLNRQNLYQKYLKIIILTWLIISLSACDFRAVSALSQVNAKLAAPKNSLFAQQLKTYLNPNLTKTLRVEIGKEKKQQNIASYQNGIASGHYLALHIPVKVYKEKHLILTTTLTQGAYLTDSQTTLANQLQQQAQYRYLRTSLAQTFARQLNQLNQSHRAN